MANVDVQPPLFFLYQGSQVQVTRRVGEAHKNTSTLTALPHVDNNLLRSWGRGAACPDIVFGIVTMGC